MKNPLKEAGNFFKKVLQRTKPVVKMPEDQIKEEKRNPFYIPEHREAGTVKPYFENKAMAKKKAKRRVRVIMQKHSRRLNRKAA